MRPMDFARIVRDKWPLLWKELAGKSYGKVVGFIDNLIGQKLSWDELKIDGGFPAMLRYLEELDERGKLERFKVDDSHDLSA